MNTFAGPSDKGVYSKSVQQTLYQMAAAALKAEGGIDSVSLPHYTIIVQYTVR